MRPRAALIPKLIGGALDADTWVLPINRDGNRPRRGNVEECALVEDFPIPKQPRQERQGLLGQDRVHEGFLSIKCFGGAAAWFGVGVERRIRHFPKIVRPQFVAAFATSCFSRSAVRPK